MKTYPTLPQTLSISLVVQEAAGQDIDDRPSWADAWLEGCGARSDIAGE